ncbi:DNA/RNA nuclease SfsA [candidate division KSB1 bacterium]|nr:DNA/RNA nuclease SfsA [candidate division KSB1 bacterium]
MKLPPLRKGILLKRYKRFLADISLDTGQTITAYCPNTGSMLSCDKPGSPVLVSFHPKPGRKYQYTWELIYVHQNWVGINTMYPNKIVKEAIKNKRIPELIDFDKIQSEVAYGENSRIDLLLQKNKTLCYVEVKNVTLAKDNTAFFPDAVTARGTKHLLELANMVKLGHRAVMFYLVQRTDADLFRPAIDIDPTYSQTLDKVHKTGVEILVYRTKISPEEIIIDRALPFKLDHKTTYNF